MKLHGLLFVSAVIHAAGLAMTLLLGVQLARYLGPTGYGIYGLIMAVVTIAVVVAKFGLPFLATREAARRDVDLRSLLRWFAARAVTISVATALVMAAGLLLINPVWIHGRSELVVLAAIFVVLSALLSCGVGALRGAGSNLTGQIIELLLWPTIIVLIVFAAHAIGPFSAREALGCQIAALVTCLIVCLGTLVSLTQALPQGPRGFSVPGWFGTSATFMANNLLGALNASYPMIVAGMFVGGRDLGILRVALASSGLLGLPSSIANIATVPVAARELAADDANGLSRTLSHTTMTCFALTAFGWLSLAVIGRPAISFLFGRAYEGAYMPMLVLGAGHVIIAAFGIAGSYLNLTSRERLVTKAFVISVSCGLAVSFASTPYVGIIGAASGTVVMAAVWHFYVFGFPSRKVRVPLSLFAAVAYSRSPVR